MWPRDSRFGIHFINQSFDLSLDKRKKSFSGTHLGKLAMYLLCFSRRTSSVSREYVLLMQTLRLRFVSESLIFSNLLAHNCRMRFRSSRNRSLAEIIGTRGLLLFSSGVDRGGPNMSESSSWPVSFSKDDVLVLRCVFDLIVSSASILVTLISLLLSSAAEGVSIRSIISPTSPAVMVLLLEVFVLLSFADALIDALFLEAVVMTTSSQFCAVGNVIMVTGLVFR